MPRHRSPRSISSVRKSAIFIPAVIAVLFVSPAAKTQDTNAPNPENVLVMQSRAGTLFSRWITTPTAEAAARNAKRAQGVRGAKTGIRTTPATEQPAPAATASSAAPAAPAASQSAEPAWPNASANVGGAMIAPLTIKTVREMVEPETPLVFENELSDIDLAAPPKLAEARPPAPSATTDGSGAIENDATEQARVFAMGETMKAVMQSAWLEPVLLMLAGALAALSAVRLFA